MEVDYWTIMARISSQKQKKYFGEYGAFRPYVLFIVDINQPVDDELIKQILQASFYNIVVEGVSYKKYFELSENATFEFQYARVQFDEWNNHYHYIKFRKLVL